jgi:hypothetical protein
LHAATAFVAADKPLPELLSEQAGAVLSIAARFEEAADLACTGTGGENQGEAHR